MAKKTLIVVESPAKAKTINKYLGSDYIVEASVGHIKDLIKVKLGVDIEHGFEPKYTTIKGKAEIIKRLKQLAEKSKKVLVATDPDREGEAIAWHIAEEIKEKNNDIQRVLFNEITKNGIKKGIEDPRQIDDKLFMSQQARRVMDRLIGYQVSPFVSKALITKTSKALSAGRVQSVALRLISEREEEIQNFVPIEYWSILGNFQTENSFMLQSRLYSFDGEGIKNPEGSAKAAKEEDQKELDEKIANLNFIRSDNDASLLIGRISREHYNISSINKRETRRNAPPPFTTSLIQQEAAKRLNFANKKTMQVAQKLYEGVTIGSETVGLITYMRTDSQRISPEAEEAARAFIENSYGADYLPLTPNRFTSKSTNVQDAHEAIRPTSLDYKPSEVRKYLSKDEADLYELIYNRFIASQMKHAVIEQTSINITGGSFVFRTTGSVIIFKGFLAVYDDIKEPINGNGKEESGILPEGLREGQSVNLNKLDKNQSFTKAKPRFSEATLVKELDELGIGRPSTYAQIISTLTEREYVELSKKVFQPTELGMEVNNILTKNFPDLFNVDFTAEMEKELDDIAEGTNSYTGVLNSFYEPFSKSLQAADEKNDIPEIPCPVCGSPMIIRVSRKGRFLGCSRYPECNGTQPLPKGEMDKVTKKEPEIAPGIICVCGKPMVIREGKFGKFYGCSGYPECKEIKPFTSGVKCPKCNEGDIVERYSPKSKKKFWGCSRYPTCDYLSNYEPVHIPCKHCHNPYLEYRYRKVDEGYEKYLNCPSCKVHYELNELAELQEHTH